MALALTFDGEQEEGVPGRSPPLCARLFRSLGGAVGRLNLSVAMETQPWRRRVMPALWGLALVWRLGVAANLSGTPAAPNLILLLMDDVSAGASFRGRGLGGAELAGGGRGKAAVRSSWTLGSPGLGGGRAGA